MILSVRWDRHGQSSNQRAFERMFSMKSREGMTCDPLWVRHPEIIRWTCVGASQHVTSRR